MLREHKEWFTIADLVDRLHITERHVRRVLKPYREHCHLGRRGRHPRKVLWVPRTIVLIVERERGQ